MVQKKEVRKEETKEEGKSIQIFKETKGKCFNYSQKIVCCACVHIAKIEKRGKEA